MLKCYKKRIQQRRANHLYRQHLIFDGDSVINFSSNDYLGLSQHPDIKKIAIKAIDKYGVGGQASQLVCGHTQAHDDLTKAFANFLDRDRALIFSSGYLANLAILTTLAEKNDTVFQDRQNHASLIDGGRYCAATMHRYSHRNYLHLQHRLASNSSRHRFIVSDAVFSMSGAQADIKKIAQLGQQYQADVIIDEAHAIGLLGHNGSGATLAANCHQSEVALVVCPLGKAFGVNGAIVAGKNEYIDALLQFGRPYTYTTALPAHLASAALKSLHIIQTEQWRREKLQFLIQTLQKCAQELQIPLLPSQTAIQAVMIGDASMALALSAALKKQGILVGTMRPPSVPAHQSLLRITLNCQHTEQQIKQLMELLARHYEQTSTGLITRLGI